jgi:hypothetical protein
MEDFESKERNEFVQKILFAIMFLLSGICFYLLITFI